MAVAKLMSSAVKDSRTIRIPNGRGGHLEGALHADWTIKEARSLVGRNMDLESAYRNLVARKADLSFGNIAVFNPVSLLPNNCFTLRSHRLCLWFQPSRISHSKKLH